MTLPGISCELCPPVMYRRCLEPEIGRVSAECNSRFAGPAMAAGTRPSCSSNQVRRFLANLLDGDMHAKRVLSLANATLGVIKTASLAVNTIGQGLALARAAW